MFSAMLWDVEDFEGLVDALLATPAAATVYLDCKRNKLVAGAAAAAFDVLDFCDGGFVDLVGDLAFFSSACGKLAVAAAAAMIGLFELFEGYFPFLVGGFVLTSLMVQVE